MSTLQAPHRAAPSLHIGRRALVILAILVATAIAVAVVAVTLTSTNASTTHRPPAVSTVNDTGPAYQPPHDWATIKATQAWPAGETAANDQTSSAYTKAELYQAAR
jgi:hypothetical protein